MFPRHGVRLECRPGACPQECRRCASSAASWKPRMDRRVGRQRASPLSGGRVISTPPVEVAHGLFAEQAPRTRATTVKKNWRELLIEFGNPVVVVRRVGTLFDAAGIELQKANGDFGLKRHRPEIPAQAGHLARRPFVEQERDRFAARERRRAPPTRDCIRPKRLPACSRNKSRSRAKAGFAARALR
jgi:hypothetical protein